MKSYEYIICDKCKGTGNISDIAECPKCLGEGKLTWIENIFGKQPNGDIYYRNNVGILEKLLKGNNNDRLVINKDGNLEWINSLLYATRITT